MKVNPPINREDQGADPILPRAFTIDIETLALPAFRERIGSHLERNFQRGAMRLEQQQRYLEDIAAEEERCYQLGSLNAVSGRVLSIAAHVGTIPGLEVNDLAKEDKEYLFGIDAFGTEQPEPDTLTAFLNLMSDFDSETDQLVGHNILGFDLPFILQRCLINNIPVGRLVELIRYGAGGVFDTMHRWWLGDRRGRVSLDDLAWALGIESSKTETAEGSKVFDLYHAGRLNEIREYNLRDVRVTRKVYERLLTGFGS
jgi:hypothetical protein